MQDEKDYYLYGNHIAYEQLAGGGEGGGSSLREKEGGGRREGYRMPLTYTSRYSFQQ